MSNRSLFEINHDMTHRIDRDPVEFVAALVTYLRSGSRRESADLERFGLRCFGRRHHSDEFVIDWGGHKAAEIKKKDAA